jgi:hypothetical protein
LILYRNLEERGYIEVINITFLVALNDDIICGIRLKEWSSLLLDASGIVKR